jgi:hypothetical protein
MWSFYGQPCATVYSVEEVIQKSRFLDGKSICIVGLIRVRVSREGSQKLAFEIESKKPLVLANRGKARIGIVDVAETEGIFLNQYKPNSFELLDVAASLKNARPDAEYVLEVEIKGAIVLNKKIQKRIVEQWPSDYPIKAPAFKPNRFELILLEVLSAHLTDKAP